MLKFAIGALMVAALPLTATAQTSNSSPQSGAMTAPNSGAGVPGQPGNKNGPAAPRPGTTGAEQNPPGRSGMSMPQPATTDASKIPGKPGGKAGPAAKPPSGSTGK